MVYLEHFIPIFVDLGEQAQKKLVLKILCFSFFVASCFDRYEFERKICTHC